MKKPQYHLLARISHQFACHRWKYLCCQYIMVIISLCCHPRLRWMRSLRPSLDATLWAAVAVQIGCPADLSRWSFSRQRARASSTVVPATLSVAGTRWREKSCAIFASIGEICGLVILLAPLCVLQGCAPVAVTGATTAVTTLAADRRTTGTFIEDEAIEIKSRLALSDKKELNKRVHINFTSFNTSVLVSGEAPTEEDRQAVIDLVKNVEKVTRVFDEITLAAPSSLLSRSADTVVTAKIKSKLIAEKDLSSLHVKVTTEDGVAYLMGLVTTEEGDIATEIARRTGGVQKVVKLFEYRESLRKTEEEKAAVEVDTGEM